MLSLLQGSIRYHVLGLVILKLEINNYGVPHCLLHLGNCLLKLLSLFCITQFAH